jgi:hypothetical protein
MTIKNTYLVLQAMDAIEKGTKPLEIDASATEWFGPLGTTLLALAIARRVAKGGSPPTFIAPVADDARHFLDDVGIERYLEGRGAELEASPSTGTREMRQLVALDPVYIQQVADMLAERVPGMGERVRHFIELCLKELLQNVFEHAPETPGGRVDCFLHARWYKREGNVRLAVVDGGIGIPAALRREQVRGLQRSKDADVVVAAVIQEGLTSAKGRRGLGLKLIRDIVTQRDGSLTILSHTAKVTFERDGRVMKGRKLPVFFRGTAIEIDFRPHKDVPLGAPVDEVF